MSPFYKYELWPLNLARDAFEAAFNSENPEIVLPQFHKQVTKKLWLTRDIKNYCGNFIVKSPSKIKKHQNRLQKQLSWSLLK